MGKKAEPVEMSGYGLGADEALDQSAQALDIATDLIPVVAETKATLQAIQALAKLLEDPKIKDKIKRRVRKAKSVWKSLRSAFLSGGKQPIGGFELFRDVQAPHDPERVERFLDLLGGMCL